MHENNKQRVRFSIPILTAFLGSVGLLFHCSRVNLSLMATKEKVKETREEEKKVTCVLSVAMHVHTHVQRTSTAGLAKLKRGYTDTFVGTRMSAQRHRHKWVLAVISFGAVETKPHICPGTDGRG